ncbi:MAG: hypothetical protein ABJL99_18430 [Aliishimia sp.]
MKFLQSLFGDAQKDGLDPIRAALSEAEVPPTAPAPWEHVTTCAVGGLTAVGFERSSETLLVISQSGQSVMDATTGTRLYRNRAADGYDVNALKAARLDHPAIERMDMAGLHGGALRRETEDGWSVDMFNLIWPETCCVLHPPNASIYFLKKGWTQGIKDPTFHLMAREREDVRAFGFSWTGRSLLLATPSTLTIWARTAPLHLV